MNRFHPIYHSTSNQAGSRIDVERLLPISPEIEEAETLLDNLSEPPHFAERLAPVRTQIANEIVRGKNWTDLMIRTYRTYGRMWSRLTMFVHTVLRDQFKERGMLPFLSVCIDPDTLHRIIENDYEEGENTYGSIMQLYGKGIIAPCATVPFGLMLPLLDSDFDRRLVIRMGFTFYSRILDIYHNYIQKVHKEKAFVLPFWLPESAYCHKTMEILYDEFKKYADGRKLDSPHLVLLLDNVQVNEGDNDALMKSWNTMPIGPRSNGSISVVIRDKTFSDWVSYSNPSVKKLLDRTIAKVDSDLSAEDVNYCWSHFEDLEALSFSPKSAVNFEQKMLKLTELGYMPVSPDVYVRRKLSGKFGLARNEPHKISLVDKSAAEGWGEDSPTLARWLGLRSNNGDKPKVGKPRPYVRLSREGKIEEAGSQCWKIGYNEMRRRLFSAVRGDPAKFKGGALEVLASLIPGKCKATVQRNVEAFLADYAYVYWREHFIQHDLSEADINIVEVLKSTLFKGVRKKPAPTQCAVAGAAAQAYYFALDGHRASDTRQTNFDQRAVYQNTMMLALAACNMIYVYRWMGDKKREKAMYATLKSELLEFEDAHRRYNLSAFGFTKKEWKQTIRSHVEDSNLNCVARAARRAAARRLRPLGYRRQFTRKDENLTTNVGHMWDSEVHTMNYRWENDLFCGVLEE